MKLYLDIFSFDSRIDFQSGYVRFDANFSSNSTLKDVLAKIPSKLFGYQEFGVDLDRICCRINGIAILDNVGIKELAEQFGTTWRIDPLSKKYAKKDLLLDIDIAFKKYERFFNAAHFVYPNEREKLKEFLLFNFISQNHDDEYYGDGFFLYVRWLMGRHPMQSGQLLQFVSHAKYGVFSHIPTAHFIFPANPFIDNEIYALQSQLINSTQYTATFSEWIELGKKMQQEYGFKCEHKIAQSSDLILRDYLVKADSKG